MTCTPTCAGASRAAYVEGSEPAGNGLLGPLVGWGPGSVVAHAHRAPRARPDGCAARQKESIALDDGFLLLSGTDVPTLMTRVKTALARDHREPGRRTGPIFVHREGDDEVGIARLRTPATVEIEFPSGSARPVVGPAVRLAKRVVRRGLRWYVKPIVDQQNRFNHAVLDLAERLRLQNEQLRNELELLRPAQPDEPGRESSSR